MFRAAYGALLGSAALMGFLASPTSADETPTAYSANKWKPWFELGGRVSGERSLGEGNLFLPLHQNHDTLFFADVRGMFDDHEAREGNIGLGVRRMLPGGWNLGGHGYFDMRRSSMGNRFNQVVLGGEALSETFDLRGNVYLPVGSRERRQDLPSVTTTSEAMSRAFYDASRSNLAIETGQWTTTTEGVVTEKALAGFDAEVGARVPVFDPASGLDLRVFGGGYYFDAAGMEAVRGPRGRLEFSAQALDGRLGGLLPGLRLTAGVTLQHDGPRGQQTIGYARLRLPLQRPAQGAQPLTYMERRMTEAVVRDVDIVSNSSSESRTTTSYSVEAVDEDISVVWDWDPETPQQVNSFTYIDGTEGHAVVQGHLDAQGADAIVVLTGELDAEDNTVIVNADQALLGSGTDLHLRGASGVEAAYRTEGAEGQSRMVGQGSPSQGNLVQLNDRSVLAGMTVRQENCGATTCAAVLVRDSDDAVIYGNDITGAGISMVLSNNTLIHGNDVTANSSRGDAAITVILGEGSVISGNNIVNYADDRGGILLVVAHEIEVLNNKVRLGEASGPFGIIAVDTTGRISGNDISIFSDQTALGLNGSTTAVRFSDNTLRAKGGTLVVWAGGEVKSGSDGNEIVGNPDTPSCVSGGGTGEIGFTDGTTCP